MSMKNITLVYTETILTGKDDLNICDLQITLTTERKKESIKSQSSPTLRNGVKVTVVTCCVSDPGLTPAYSNFNVPSGAEDWLDTDLKKRCSSIS